MKNNHKNRYKNPVQCPRCGKVFAEIESIHGTVVIKKLCPKCDDYVYITKKG